MTHRKEIEVSDNFLFALKWILAVTERYPGTLHFGLAHISMGSGQVLGDAYGAQEASRKLGVVSAALRRAFRNTDLVARDGTDFWILAPYTPPSETITRKIMGIIEEASKDGLDISDRNIAIFSLPLKGFRVDENRSASSYLRELKLMCESEKNCDLLCESKACLKVSIQAE